MLTRTCGRGVLIVLVATLAVAGCSDDKDNSTTRAAEAAEPTAGASVTPTASAAGTSKLKSAPDPAGGSKGHKPPVAVSLAPVVRVGKPAEISDNVRIIVGKVRDLKVGAQQPGEIAGPAAAVSVTVRNTSKKRFSLDGMVVTAFYHNDLPANETSVDPAKPLTGSLAVGKTVTGTYVFTVPKKYASTLRVEVSSDQSPTIVQFAR
jgi:uncharacterized protein DUF4352